MTASIILQDVTVAYNRHPAIHHIKGTFNAGELTAITGPNGAGKSTLLKAMAGILPVYEGSIALCGAERRDIAYMPQSSTLETDFPLNLLEMVASGFWQENGGFKAITPLQKAKSREALVAVGLAGFENRTLDTLSVGQLQRALFARIMVQDAKIILLDEPFNAIDASTTEVLLGIIKTWRKEKRTVICVLHDFEQIKTHFNRCLLIAREMIAWGNVHDVLSPENLLSTRFLKYAFGG